jgi:glycerol-3-phosphate O-acyltransferase/dihydroxyacetone phosphate acyltransferase
MTAMPVSSPQAPPPSRPGAAHRLLAGGARLLLALFYRRVELVGIERVPARGPVVLAANHHNALVDAMLLLSVIPRALRPLAKAPLFRHPIVGPLLRAVGAIPVRRRQDEGSSPDNEAMFAAAGRALAAGEALLIFPEGVSQPEPALKPLRTGAARISLAAAGEAGAAGGGGAPPALLPVGLVYHEPATFRTGWALVLVGPPVAIGDYTALAATAPDEAVRQLTRQLTEALGRLIVEAGDRETLRLIRVTERIWSAERGETQRAPADRAEWWRRVARAHRHLAVLHPARLAALRADVDRYARDVERARVALDTVTGWPRASTVARYVASQVVALTFGLPLGVVGILYNAVPYGATALVVRVARPEPDTAATYKILGGSLIYPVCWVCEAGLIWMAGGGAGLAVFLATLLPASLLALGWADRVLSVGGEIASVIRLVVHRDVRRHLLARRRQLAEELTRLAGEVPESVLAGDALPEPRDGGGLGPARDEASKDAPGEPRDGGGRGPACHEASEDEGPRLR